MLFTKESVSGDNNGDSGLNEKKFGTASRVANARQMFETLEPTHSLPQRFNNQQRKVMMMKGDPSGPGLVNNTREGIQLEFTKIFEERRQLIEKSFLKSHGGSEPSLSKMIKSDSVSKTHPDGEDKVHPEQPSLGQQSTLMTTAEVAEVVESTTGPIEVPKEVLVEIAVSAPDNDQEIITENPFEKEKLVPLKSLSIDSSEPWSELKTVILHITSDQPTLGLVIVKGDNSDPNIFHSDGIYVQSIMPHSVVALSNEIEVGDKIVKVNDTDVINMSLDEVLQLFSSAVDSGQVTLCVAHLNYLNCPIDEDEIYAPTLSDSEDQSSESNNIENHWVANDEKKEMDFQRGKEIGTLLPFHHSVLTTLNTAENISPTDVEMAKEFETETEDEGGCPFDMLSQKYADFGGEVIVLEIIIGESEKLGIFLIGNKDLAVMNVFVCGIRSGSVADVDGQLQVGDQLLEVNQHCLLGRSHVNVTPIIRSCLKFHIIRMIIRRDSSNMENMPPVKIRENSVCSNPPSRDHTPYASIASSRKSSSVGGSSVANLDLHGLTMSSSFCQTISCTIVKGDQGFGFAIMEDGFNDEPGIFIREIATNSPAELEGSLRSGDQIIKVGDQEVLEMAYDEVLTLLRGCFTEVNLTVSRCGFPLLPDAVSQRSRKSSQDLSNQLASPEANNFTTPMIITSMVSKDDYRPSSPKSPQRSTNVLQDPLLTNQQMSSSSSMSMLDPSGLARNSPSPTPQLLPGSRRSSAVSIGGSPLPLSSRRSSTASTCHIMNDGQETYIEINKGNKPLGIGVVGGAHTALKAVVIYELYEDGAALADNRLSPGDILLKVNEVDFSTSSLSEIRQALFTCSERVGILVRRGATGSEPLAESHGSNKENLLSVKSQGGQSIPVSPTWREEDLLQPYTVLFQRKPGKGLGIGIAGRQSASAPSMPSNFPTGLQGVFIKEVVKSGLAESDGRILPGDLILEVNGKDVRGKDLNHVAYLVKSSPSKVSLLLGRIVEQGNKRKGSLLSDSNLNISMNKKKGKAGKSPKYHVSNPV